MNPPKTALDICNLALAKLGEEPIPGIDPNGSLASRLCYIHYHPVRREILCSRRWQFADTTVELQAYNNPENKNSYLFHIPQDTLCIRNKAGDWKLNGRTIIAPSPTLTLHYTADIESVEQFSSTFTAAFVIRLARKLCIPLLNSSRMLERLTKEYHTIINEPEQA